MRAALNAIKARITGAPTYVVVVPPNTLPPYYVLEPVVPGDLERRLSASDPRVAFDARLKAVAGTGDGALIMLDNAKAELSPDGAPTSTTSGGRRVEVAHERFEAAYEDRDITIPATNRHPALAVDTYHVDSQPA